MKKLNYNDLTIKQKQQVRGQYKTLREHEEERELQEFEIDYDLLKEKTFIKSEIYEDLVDIIL